MQEICFRWRLYSFKSIQREPHFEIVFFCSLRELYIEFFCFAMKFGITISISLKSENKINTNFQVTWLSIKQCLPWKKFIRFELLARITDSYLQNTNKCQKSETIELLWKAPPCGNFNFVLLSNPFSLFVLENEKYLRVPGDFLFMQTSQFILVVAYERYFAMCRSFDYKTKFTAQFRFKINITTILVSTLIAGASFADVFFSPQPHRPNNYGDVPILTITGSWSLTQNGNGERKRFYYRIYGQINSIF